MMHQGVLVSFQPNNITGQVGLKGSTDTDGLPMWNPIAFLYHLMSYQTPGQIELNSLPVVLPLSETSVQRVCEYLGNEWVSSKG